MLVCVSLGRTTPVESSVSSCVIGRASTGGSAVAGRDPPAVLPRVRLYVGRLLRKRPRLGTKREFWTFVRVVRVETSGSGAVLVENESLRLMQHTNNIEEINHLVIILVMVIVA